MSTGAGASPTDSLEHACAPPEAFSELIAATYIAGGSGANCKPVNISWEARESVLARYPHLRSRGATPVTVDVVDIETDPFFNETEACCDSSPEVTVVGRNALFGSVVAVAPNTAGEKGATGATMGLGKKHQTGAMMMEPQALGGSHHLPELQGNVIVVDSVVSDESTTAQHPRGTLLCAELQPQSSSSRPPPPPPHNPPKKNTGGGGGI